jgi:hypothetical protein
MYYVGSSYILEMILFALNANELVDVNSFEVTNNSDCLYYLNILFLCTAGDRPPT